MTFLELAEKRYSCRKFSALLKAAQLAPTAVNFQPQRILVITDKEKIKSLDENGCTRYTFNAPLMMVVCYDKGKSWKRSFDGKDEGIVDASIITTHMMLEAVELGLGSTWVGAFDPAKAREILEVPENYEIVSLLPIGYPAMEPSERHHKRIDISEFTFRNKF